MPPFKLSIYNNNGGLGVWSQSKCNYIVMMLGSNDVTGSIWEATSPV